MTNQSETGVPHFGFVVSNADDGPGDRLLLVGPSQKLKTVPQAILIAHQSPNLQRQQLVGQRHFQPHDFSRNQCLCDGGADAVLAQLGRPPPERYARALAERSHIDAQIDRISGVPSTGSRIVIIETPDRVCSHETP